MTELVDPDAEAYAARHTAAFTGHLAEVGDWTQAHTDAPQMMSGLAEARLLQAFIVASEATHVLEVGTFTGFGALAMAAALPKAGRLTTIEKDEQTAQTARRHIDASPHSNKIELIVGDALEVIGQLTGPFDLVYIDAWKADYPAYYEAVLAKLSPHGIIVADNLFRAGRALDPEADDESTRGIRAFAEQVQADPRVDNVLVTIGDGLMLAWPRPAATR